MAGDPAGNIYGAALFAAAQESGRLKAVADDLSSFGESLASSPQLASVMFNPAFPPAGKKQVLSKLTEGSDPLVTNALHVLVDNNRIHALADVVAAFDERYQRAAKQIEVELTTAIEIDDALAGKVSRRLAEATGREVELHRRVDPAILGGAVLRSRGNLIDASVRGRLDALRLSLRSARLAGTVTGGEA